MSSNQFIWLHHYHHLQGFDRRSNGRRAEELLEWFRLLLHDLNNSFVLLSNHIRCDLLLFVLQCMINAVSFHTYFSQELVENEGIPVALSLDSQSDVMFGYSGQIASFVIFAHFFSSWSISSWQSSWPESLDSCVAHFFTSKTYFSTCSEV